MKAIKFIIIAAIVVAVTASCSKSRTHTPILFGTVKKIKVTMLIEKENGQGGTHILPLYFVDMKPAEIEKSLKGKSVLIDNAQAIVTLAVPGSKKDTTIEYAYAKQSVGDVLLLSDGRIIKSPPIIPWYE